MPYFPFQEGSRARLVWVCFPCCFYPVREIVKELSYFVKCEVVLHEFSIYLDTLFISVKHGCGYGSNITYITAIIEGFKLLVHFQLRLFDVELYFLAAFFIDEGTRHKPCTLDDISGAIASIHSALLLKT